MQYKIKAFNPATGSIVVNFFTEAFPSGLQFNIDVPVENGAFLTGDKLHDHIMAFAPHGQIARIVETAAASNAGALAAIVEADPEPAPVETPVPTPKDPILDADTVEQSIAAAERQIDKAASDTRGKFMTAGVGMVGVYLIKVEQARALVESGYTATPGAYIAACAAMLNRTPRDVADEILALNELWVNQIDPNIEGIRLAGKAAVRSQTTREAVDIAMRPYITQLQAIKPA